MVKVLATFLLTGSLAFAAVFRGTDSPQFNEYLANGIEKIHVENTSGKITINPLLVNKIEIAATRRKFNEKCSYQVEKSDYAEIIVRVDSPAGEDCVVDLDLKVPREVDLNITNGSGNVAINGIQGNLTFNVGSGSVIADGKFKKVEGKAGSGRVELNGLTSGGNIHVGNGPVSLKFLEYPMGLMDVKTGNGDAIVSFPKGSKINATLGTGQGQVFNELGTTSSADFGISVKTGSGDLNVKAY